MLIKIDKKCFLTSLLILFFYLFPILTSNVYYLDDTSRVMLGYFGWLGDGRPVGELFYRVLAFGRVVPDLFPFPFFVSIILTAITFSMLCNKLGNNKSILFSFCICPLILSPLFVSNLHFRYDAPFMMIAIIFAILPFCVVYKNKYLFFINGSLSLTLSLSSYQVAVNVFIIFSSLEFLMNFYQKKSNFSMKLAISRIAMLLTGYLIYEKLIIKNLNTNYYFNSYNKLIPFDTNFPSKLLVNFNKFFIYFLQNMDIGFFIFIIPLISIFILSIIILISIKSKISSISNASSLVIPAFVIIFVSIFGICGIVIFGQNPLLHSRIYVGFGAAITAMLIPICWVNPSKNISKMIYFLMLISYVYMFSFGFAANNAIREDNNHIENIVKMIVHDIVRTQNIEFKTILVSGKLNNSSQAAIAYRNFPLIKDVLPKSFDNNYDAGQFILNRLGLPNLKYFKNDSYSYDDKKCNYISNNDYYSLCKTQDNILLLHFM